MMRYKIILARHKQYWFIYPWERTYWTSVLNMDDTFVRALLKLGNMR